MKATKKIVGAACALVAAVALSAGSTFAWFSQSGKVTATGMKVQAASSKALAISTSEEGSYDVIADVEDASATELWPSSTVNGKDYFYVSNLDSIDGASGAISATTEFAKVPANQPVDDKTYTKSYEYWIKAMGEEDTTYATLYVSSIKIENKGTELTAATAKAISKAIRVSVTWDGGETFLYSPLNNPANTKGVSMETEEGVTDAEAALGTVSYKTVGDTDADLTGATGNVTTTPKKVTITIWYEGQDTNCTSFNALEVEELTVSVSFAAGIAD